MPLYMDTHHQVEGLTAEAVTAAHAKDLEVQDKYGVKYLRYTPRRNMLDIVGQSA